MAPKFGELSVKIEERAQQAYQAEAMEEVREEYPKYIEALTKHPRMLVGDFLAAEACLKAAIGELGAGGLALKTEMLMHPLERLEGGLTLIETRCLEELGRGAGAGAVCVWTGAPLRDAEVLARLGRS